MYAVIRTGGKQYKVEAGQRVEVERVGTDPGGEIELAPILLVDGAKVLATPSELGKALVKAKVVEDTKGPKINGFVYKPKSNNRKRWGHRQHYSLLEITSITPG
ncbi:MAG: 50S ribosomal protein L21 [Acidimicrobiia bacterium]|nr:50S ribosomal protein L21 [Acidimicrobiia bacterium]